MLLLVLALFAPAASAQVASPDLAPDALLRAVSVEVIAKIRQGPDLQAMDPAEVAVLVENSILPLFDFTHMTRLAMARNWRLATPEQQRLLTDEFTALLVRTYTTALAHYRGEPIEFKPLRLVQLATDVTVRSELRQTGSTAGNERMTLDYDMESTATGWKIYDVKVAGVRLVSTYRDVFAEKVREVGVDGLIKFLEDGNHGGSSKFNSVKTSFWEKSRVMYLVLQNLFRNRGQ
jgi:phospholipid transport system substrate-binding protein